MRRDFILPTLHPVDEPGLDLNVGLLWVKPAKLQSHHLDAGLVQVKRRPKPGDEPLWRVPVGHGQNVATRG